MKMMAQKAEEEKERTRRDGAKLSFQEKMELFAASSGSGDAASRDKAKISKAQREIDGEYIETQE